jgi:hypothetical protein
MKLKSAQYAVVLVLVLLVSACVKSTVTMPTSQQPVIDTPVAPSGDLVIASTKSFVDAFGTYRVVGQVINNSSSVLNSIELTIEVKDASGNSLLKDDNGNITPYAIFYPMLYTVAPGEASPFEYSYDTTNGTPAAFSVAITGQASGNAYRATLQWEDVQLVDDGSGSYYLTGKLVNTGSQWAHINGLAGGVLDDSNNLLSVNLASTYTTELAPAGDTNGDDRTPFEITFPIPGGSTKWQLNWDADVTDNVADYSMEVKITNRYFDQDGSARIVGWITNNSTQTLNVSNVVAGLYATDGTVLDAGNSSVPVPIKPGSATSFSISEFGIVNHNPGQAALVQTCSAQVDQYFTLPTPFEFVDLNADTETVQKDGATWIINGSVTNKSGVSLSTVAVVVMIMDTQNKLVAMEYTSINPTGDAISSGETNPYLVSVYLNPAVDATSFTTSTVIIGKVK